MFPIFGSRAYQWGGGSDGNAGISTITSLINSIPFVASVTNPLPSTLGADEETVEEAEARAPQAIRTLSRAVSADDFVTLAIATPGARIQARYRDSFAAAANAGGASGGRFRHSASSGRGGRHRDRRPGRSRSHSAGS